MTEQFYDSGLVSRVRDEYKVTNLPDTVGVNQSLLNAPIYVLNDKSASKLDTIEISWVKKLEDGTEVKCTFRFSRQANMPFPTVTHAKYLDILLSMFSQNWNQDGILHFRYCDVLKIAGKAPVSRAREAIQQTIARYHCHTTAWENCWNGRKDTFTFNIIRKSSIFDDFGKIKFKSPRKSKSKEDWHTIVFDPEIVKAMKDEKKRILLTDLFQKLEHDTFCVYRYYYGYPDFYIDSNGTKRKHIIWRNKDVLRNIFKWTGPKSRFDKWIMERFAELLEMNLIDEPQWNKDAVGIHCKNLSDIRKEKDKVVLLSNYEEIGNSSYNKKDKLADISNLTPEAILTEYNSRKQNGSISASSSQAIDLLIKNKLIDSAISLIKNQILVN